LAVKVLRSKKSKKTELKGSIIDAVRAVEILDVLDVLRSQLHTMRMEPVEEEP
jgi:hypothetical protein